LQSKYYKTKLSEVLHSEIAGDTVTPLGRKSTPIGVDLNSISVSGFEAIFKKIPQIENNSLGRNNAEEMRSGRRFFHSSRFSDRIS
jgi:hypothetical protein